MDDHLNKLLNAAKLDASEAAEGLPAEPGLYAMFVAEPAAFPEPYRRLLRARQTDLVYIGRAKESLRDRAYDEEMRHRRPATFFRSLGAVLGYLPLPGTLLGRANQRNYRFSRGDTVRIMSWIDQHVRVSVLALPALELLDVEPGLIAAAQPLLNIQHNPACLSELRAARNRCVAAALCVPTEQ